LLRTLSPGSSKRLIATLPYGVNMVCRPWSIRRFEATPMIGEGGLIVPGKPGLGLAFDQTAIKTYEVK